jgi:hypothetical protein
MYRAEDGLEPTYYEQRALGWPRHCSSCLERCGLEYAEDKQYSWAVALAEDDEDDIEPDDIYCMVCLFVLRKAGPLDHQRIARFPDTPPEGRLES